MQIPDVRIETERLILRPPHGGDFEGWAALMADPEQARYIGGIGPWCPEGWPGTEVGWSLLADATGRGYAQEAAAASIDWAFDHLGWREVIHTIDPANAASIALARRLGSRHQRTGCFLPDPFSTTEVEVWGQSREEWRARRSSEDIA